MKTKIFYPFVLPILALLAYFPTLSGEFILDDRPLVQNNAYIKSLHTPVSYLSQEDGAGTGYYRPLVNFTYWLDYAIWGMDGKRFRASNLFYHLVACLLFFLIMQRITGDSHVSFWIAALFAVHPVNTEAVSWVSSRNNILVTVFGLASFHFFLKADEKSSAGYGSLSLIFFAGALLSKEFGLLLLPIFLLWSFLSPRRKTVYSLVRNHLPYVILICAYLLIRFWVTSVPEAPDGGEPVWRRVLVAPYLVLLNAGMIFLPLNLHSFMLRYSSTASPWQPISGLVLLVLVFFLLVTEKKRPIFRFGVSSFLVSLFPILNIVSLPSPTLISMRWLYFPMVFLLMGVSPYILLPAARRRQATALLLCILTGYLGLYTHILNRNLWHDEKTFFRTEVVHFGNLYYSSDLAEMLHQEGDYRGAEEHFAVALREGYATDRDIINYGALLIDLNKCDAALALLENAQKLVMSYEERSELHNNLAIAKFRLKRPGEAIVHFRKAVIYSPRRTAFWSNLAGAYGSMGDFTNSAAAFKRGLEIEPDSSLLRKGLALTFMNMQNYPGAVSVLEEIPYRQRDSEANALLAESRRKLAAGRKSHTLQQE